MTAVGMRRTLVPTTQLEIDALLSMNVRNLRIPRPVRVICSIAAQVFDGLKFLLPDEAPTHRVAVDTVAVPDEAEDKAKQQREKENDEGALE